jgi:hypothetical protein
LKSGRCLVGSNGLARYGGACAVNLLQIPSIVITVEPHVLDVAIGISVGAVLLIVVDRDEKFGMRGRCLVGSNELATYGGACAVNLLQIPSIVITVEPHVLDVAIGIVVEEVLLIIVDRDDQQARRGRRLTGSNELARYGGAWSVNLLQIPLITVEPHVLDVAVGVAIGKMLLLIVVDTDE